LAHPTVLTEDPFPLAVAGTEQDAFVTTSNTLAAHIWPIVSQLVYPELGSDLCGLHVVVNTRKFLGLPPTYFGNAATVVTVEGADAGEDLTQRALKVRPVGRLGEAYLMM
jgi:hypothetical protein